MRNDDNDPAGPARGPMPGHDGPGDAVAAADVGVVLLFVLLGGVFGFQFAASGPMYDVIKGLPSYWLVQAGLTAVRGGSWRAEAWMVVAVWTFALIPLARRNGVPALPWVAARRSRQAPEWGLASPS